MSLPRLFAQVLIGTLLIPLPGFFNANGGLPLSSFSTIRSDACDPMAMSFPLCFAGLADLNVWDVTSSDTGSHGSAQSFLAGHVDVTECLPWDCHISPLWNGACGSAFKLPQFNDLTSADARSSKLASRGAASSPDALIAATDYLAHGAFGDFAALPTAAFSVISPLGGTGIVKQRYKGPQLSTGCHWQQRQHIEQLTEITV
ncbi:hypothetical protein MRX96_032381 [Rhipicephalus microplus]